MGCDPVGGRLLRQGRGFGYGADSYDVSMQMANENLLPAIRKADADDLLIADGTSCRCQIKDGTNRTAKHVALVLDSYLEDTKPAN